MARLSEFALIQQYFESITEQRGDVGLGVGDDCALLQCPTDKMLAVSIDTLVENVHFFADVDPESLGHKSLAVNLSDLAAMGAEPAWFTLALTLPQTDTDWLQSFSKGLGQLARKHRISLVGGDTTRGPLSITIQVHGFVEKTTTMRRDGAKPGDLIFVTGTLGDAGACLAIKQNNVLPTVLSEHDMVFLQQRLERPVPRIAASQVIKSYASSAIDISDGLVADLSHIIDKSHCGAELDVDKLPLSPALAKLDLAEARRLALYAGDDYELCFTVPADNVDALMALCPEQCTCIGRIIEGNEISLMDNGHNVTLTGKGYEHFTND